MKEKILLRIVEGASVALIQYQNGTIENLPSRNDLYQYDGGYAWGYRGTGVQSLAYAIAGKGLGMGLKPEITGKIVLEKLSELHGNSEHDLYLEELFLENNLSPA